MQLIRGGVTALQIATGRRDEDYDQMEVLLRHGADPNKHEKEDAPLVKVLGWGDDSMRYKGFKLLLEHKADPHAFASGYNQTLLQILTEWGRKEEMELLLKHGAKASLVAHAIEHGKGLELELLLKSKANPNAVIDGKTPLQIALSAKDASNLELLLKYKADPNALIDGKTPLQIALANKDSSKLELLLKYKADPNALINGKTPLQIVLDNKDDSRMNLLLRYGADPRKSGQGPNPLERAVENGDWYQVRELLKHGADATQLYSSSYNAILLIRAIHLGNYNVVEELIKGGARNYINSSVCYGNGFSTGKWRGDSYWAPLHVAAALGRKEIAKLLLSYGADTEKTVDMVDIDGKTESEEAYGVAYHSGEYDTQDVILEYRKSRGIK